MRDVSSPNEKHATIVRITRHSRTQAATAGLIPPFLSDVKKSCYIGQLSFFLLFPIRLSDRGWSIMTRRTVRRATDCLEYISIVDLSAALKIVLHIDKIASFQQLQRFAHRADHDAAGFRNGTLAGIAPPFPAVTAEQVAIDIKSDGRQLVPEHVVVHHKEIYALHWIRLLIQCRKIPLLYFLLRAGEWTDFFAKIYEFQRYAQLENSKIV